MKTKRWLSVMILIAWLTGPAAYGQQSGDQPAFPAPGPLAPNGDPPLPVIQAGSESGGLSDWITYRRDCCEGGHGKYTPLYNELYVNAGPSVPVGGMTLSRELKTGWSITGGGRALFFNDTFSSAWVVDAHIINTNESAGRENTQFPILFFEKGIRSDQVVFEGVAGRKTFSIQDSNRTLVGLGFGREWYLGAPADADDWKWRFGVDVGGRYGSQRINFSEFGHVTDVIGSVYGAAHTDLEILCHSVLFHVGLRLEWAYTCSDILQRASDVQEVSFLFSTGLRY